MTKHGSVLGLTPDDAVKFNKALRTEEPCLECAQGAFPQFPVGQELRPPRTYGVREYWHIDLIGPFE